MADAFDPQFGEAWTTGQCLGVMTLPGVWLTLAEVDGVPAGFALVRTTLDEAELLLLGVRPRSRRRGVGASLLRGVIRDARDRGANVLHLEVRAGNGAVALYRGEGFEKVGIRRDYYRGASGDVFDAHTYRLDLSGI
ncbi:GNAT family N-acetyltransferase [Sphingomonas sp. IW22]